MPAQPDFQQRLQTIERLLETIDSAADPNLRADVHELVQLIMDLHGAGIERILEVVRQPGDGGESLVQKLGRDDLVASIMVLYGLHPMDLEARISRALDNARSRLRTHEGEVELLTLDGGAVRLRVQANGHGCGSNPQTLREIVENAVYQGAPDITSLEIEGLDDKQGFVPLEMLRGAAPPDGDGLVLTASDKGAL